MYRKIVSLLALGLIGAAVPAAAQMTPGLRCRGEDGDRGCDEARVRRQREVYDMPSLEQLQGEGVQVRRIFYSGAHEWSAWDIGALVFERRPGRGPTVRYQPPRDEEGRLPEPLVAELTPEAWRETLSSAEDIERRFAPERDGRNICIGGLDYHVEIGEPGEGGVPARLVQRTENECLNPSPAKAYARGMAALAEPFFPACRVLHFPEERESVSRLPVCAWLQGDRLASAEVRNAITPFLDFRDAAEAARLFDAFGYDAELDWNGTHVTGGRAVAEHWARAATQSEWPDFRIVSIRGETGARVLVRAELEQAERADGPARRCHRRASVEMVWIKTGDSRFTIRRVTVGPFEPFVPASLPPAIRRLPSLCAAAQPAPA